MKRYIAQNMVIFAGAGRKVSVFYHQSWSVRKSTYTGSRGGVEICCQLYVCGLYLQYDSSIAPEFHASFIVPDWGDKVDSGIGLSYRPARL